MAFSTWPATCGSGPPISSRLATPTTPLVPAARREIPEWPPRMRATIPPPRALISRAASSREARTCAPLTTACATAPPPARPRRSTPRPATSASAASLTGSVPERTDRRGRARPGDRGLEGREEAVGADLFQDARTPQHLGGSRVHVGQAGAHVPVTELVEQLLQCF